MAFLISPGVQVNEIDLTNVIPALATSTGGFAGHFTWGPVGQLVTVSSEKDLISNFGPTDSSTARSFLTAASFLKYGNNLKISRSVNETTAKNATGAVNDENTDIPNTDKRLVRNLDNYNSIATPFSKAAIIARYPGDAGNSIRVVIARPLESDFDYTGDTATVEGKIKAALSALLKLNFTSKPGSTFFADNYAANIGFTGQINDEIHVLVIDSKGVFTGIPGSVLERYEGLSLASDAKTETGSTNYYREVINTVSNYIYINPLSDTGPDEWSQADKPISEVFGASSGVTNIVPIFSNGIQTFDTRTFNYNTERIISVNSQQIETATAAGTATASGNVTVTVTIEGNTAGFQVPITSGDTAAQWAQKVRDALAIPLSSVAQRFIVSGVGDKIVLTRRPLPPGSGSSSAVYYENDNTLNIAIAANNTGITSANISENTQDGSTLVLAPHVISNILGSDGVTYNIAITAETDDGTAIVTPIDDDLPVIITFTSVPIKDSDGNPITNPDTSGSTWNTILSSEQGANITVDFGTNFDINIDINQDSNIAVAFPLYEEITTGGGYDDPTVEGLQNIQCEYGAAGSVTIAGNVISALSLFSDKETVDVNFIFSETFNQESNSYISSTQKTIDDAIASIVNTRKDCVGFISAPLDMANQLSDTAKMAYLTNKAENINSSSYLIMDSTPVYVYNKYSDSYVWISACGHMAGLCANADRVADAWFSPAGLNRGGLLGVTKLAYNADQTARDNIYKLGVNPIVSFPGQGIILYGDKTLQRKPSAFDRINVRRLFITLEKAIATAAKFQLFEQNDDFTRSSFRNAIEPFLRDVQGRRGITDFRVVCDSTNNTGEVIDGNRFVADIYIKPTRSINYITLNFVATRTGVEFKEIVG